MPKDLDIDVIASQTHSDAPASINDIQQQCYNVSPNKRTNFETL